MDGSNLTDNQQWLAGSQSAKYRSWCGYAFENVCFKHINEIRTALGISGMYTTYASWLKIGSEVDPGAQIDLLFDRPDGCINIFEIKFSEQPFVIDKSYMRDLDRKLMTFKMETKTRKTLFVTMITSNGLVDNAYKQQIIDVDLTMDCLFTRLLERE